MAERSQQHWWVFGAVVLGVALFVSLGQWQTGKANALLAEQSQRAQRNALGPLPVGAALLDAAQTQDMALAVTGTFEPQHQFFLDNRQENDQPGVHVITPLKIDGSDTRILVNRGWVGWANGRGVMPVVAVPEGVVKLTGWAMLPSTKPFFLMPESTQPPTQLWPKLDMALAAQRLNQPLQPVVLLQTGSNVPDTLVRNWAPPKDRVGMHQGYAFQWYGMAVALVLFYAVALVRKKGQA